MKCKYQPFLFTTMLFSQSTSQNRSLYCYSLDFQQKNKNIGVILSISLWGLVCRRDAIQTENAHNSYFFQMYIRSTTQTQRNGKEERTDKSISLIRHVRRSALVRCRCASCRECCRYALPALHSNMKRIYY